MRRPANWLQLVRFGAVGGVGFLVNVAVYALCVHALGLEYHVAAILAWLVAVINNFVLNRHWTFDARADRAHFQAVRFLLVSLVALGFSQLFLTLLVETAGMAKVPAQALAVAASMPLNFLGNKLWTFRARDCGSPPLVPDAERPFERSLGAQQVPILWPFPLSEDFRAGDGHLRRQLRHGWQAADRASEDGRRQQVPADLDRTPGGRVDPDEAPGRRYATADDP